MANLKVLKYNQFVLTVWGVYPQSFASAPLDWLRLLSPYLVVFSLTMGFLLAALYVRQGSTHLTYTFEALTIVFGTPQPLFAYFNMKWKMHNVAEVNGELQKIVDQGQKN